MATVTERLQELLDQRDVELKEERVPADAGATHTVSGVAVNPTLPGPADDSRASGEVPLAQAMLTDLSPVEASDRVAALEAQLAAATDRAERAEALFRMATREVGVAEYVRHGIAGIEAGRMNWLFDGHEPTQQRNLEMARAFLADLNKRGVR